ncbi:ABC transporter, permease protein [Roseovarius sp. TM1035]|uniref:ABC transporter permease n=1 Tax=Roseovarius sp. TM1035 TaxID=391613 RepID=UPI0001557385|nr:FtsX-like permease family protein [Roseovarius sp. TM1035]AWZ21252.1 ABC transporter, permease protein, putative [Roseovarius sp. AK1035]EDM30745.1 ABC transporter, permease protein [Roseovarius sp. TM1035]
MSLRIAARLARRELRGGLRGFRIFLACVILGVAAIAAVGTLRESIRAGMSEQGAAILGGDAELELTYRFASEDEYAWMARNADAVSEIADFRSMAIAPDGRRELTQLKAVDHAYPLVGTVVLSPDMPLDVAFGGAGGVPGAVMQPILAARLGITVGDTFRLGEREFRLMAELVKEPDQTRAGFGLGPRTIVSRANLDGSGLLSAGSLFTTKYRLDLPEGTDLAAFEARALQELDGSGFRWSDARNASPRVAEFVTRLGAFLVLVGLSGLAVGGVGISAALRAYLAGKVQVIATLRTLGADQRTIFLTYFIQVGVLALLGIIGGLILGVGLPVLLGPVIAARLPVPAIFAPYAAPMAEAALYSVLSVLIFTLWPLARARNIRAAALYREAAGATRRWPGWPWIATTLGLIALLLLAAILFSGNTPLTLWTAGGIGAALLVLTLAAMLVQRLARSLRPRLRGRPALGWALGAIGGPGTTAGPVMLSLGLGLAVLAAVGQIDGNLRRAIAADLPERAPSFFFVDLQKDQMDWFLDRLETDQAVSRIDNAPMLRGIISRINGRPATEVAPGHWVVEGDRAVSYADALPARTTITAGTWWGEGYSGAPQLSFAAEEAMEMGIGIGDEITVNILGRDITAPITSLREVDFSSVGMGFVLLMNPAAVAGAPHTFIATVYADDQETEENILRDVTDRFPNVTAINVRDALSQVTDLLAGLASATSWGASITLLTGFLVLIGAAAADQRARTYEAAILKTLGATRGRILTSLVLRALILGGAAGGVALGAGIGGGWAVSHFVMDTSFTVIWPSAIGIIFGGMLVTLLAGLVFALGPLRARPARTLRARE